LIRARMAVQKVGLALHAATYQSSVPPPLRSPRTIKMVRDQSLDLHIRVVRGDREALEQVAGELSPALRRRLRRAFPRTTPELIVEAAHDAILAYSARPLEFDIGRGVLLESYLYGIASRILRDRLRSLKRHSVRDGKYAQHTRQMHEYQIGDDAMLSATVRDVRAALPRICDGAELQAILAWLNDDDNDALVVNLNLSHLSKVERQAEVKRFWARMIKRLQRYFRTPPQGPSAAQKK
jgi:DNA-directed RNA polymerase specialized sigma24 family protein